MRAGLQIHLLSEGRGELPPFIETAAAVHHWVDYIHLREKCCSARELADALHELRSRGIPGSKLVVNDRIDVATAAGAGGVHLAWHSLSPEEVRKQAPQLRIGKSVHSPEEAVEAARQGAHYCLYGHIYPSASKPGQPARGIDALAETVRSCPIPIIAIGGIRPENVSGIIRAGAAGIAVLSGICSALNPARAAAAYRAAVDAQAISEGRERKHGIMD